MNSSPIGVFDSGVGGISVLKELRAVMPNEDYIYYGDCANAPYGNKTTEQVRKLSFDVFDKLVSFGVKAVVIACNTATSASVKLLREKHPDMIIIGLEPALKPAILYKKDSVILVMATPVTLREEKFAQLASEYEHMGKIIPVPCDRLAGLIEEGKTEGDEIKDYIKKIISPYGRFDSVVLGCTHYPLAREAIADVVGHNVPIFDGGRGAANETKRRLEAANFLNCRGGSIKFISSGDEKKLIEFASKYL